MKESLDMLEKSENVKVYLVLLWTVHMKCEITSELKETGTVGKTTTLVVFISRVFIWYCHIFYHVFTE